ncbi:hypothetical protein SODG_006935 [Sodalis praecaptivus]
MKITSGKKRTDLVLKTGGQHLMKALRNTLMQQCAVKRRDGELMYPIRQRFTRYFCQFR